MTARDLDKFYTKDEVAEECLQIFLEVLAKDEIDFKKFAFLEPSAGGGAFLRALDKKGLSWVAGDIEPEADGILEVDFLEELFELSKPALVIGNPPFGKKAALAIKFIERSFQYSNYVGFILPVQFQKFLTQKKLPQELQLIHSHKLPESSFTLNGKNVQVRCVFQVWAKESSLEDFRIRNAPPTSHPDFELLTYNCTEQTRWMFESDYDFAVLRQGWGDFKPKFPGTELNRSKQWMFFKASDETVLKRLLSLDFEKLSEGNTSVRGFGKAEVVEEYKRVSIQD